MTMTITLGKAGRLKWRGQRRVIVGWDGFDAAKAVQEARGEYLDRLANPKRR